MQSIIIHRIATTALMPLVAAGGYAGYSHYDRPTTLPAQGSCVVLTTDITTTTRQYQAGVANLQQYFIRRGYLRGTPNGYFDQPTERAVSRFQADNGIPATGYVDSQTRTTLQQVTCTSYPTTYPSPYPGTGYPYATGNGQLSIQGVDAPSQLAAGQTGTWTVRMAGVLPYQGGTLHYRVVWGDENTHGQASAYSYAPAANVQSSGTFTHVYRSTGTYTPVFTVTDDYGHSAQVSATTYVYAVAYGPQPVASTGYCTTALGQYDRNCYPGNPSYPTYPPSYYGGTNPGVPAGCTGYYDRSCYVNGQYIGPNASGSYVYNGPGDTCYYFNGQWQGNCNGSSFNNPGGGYVNPLGGPNGPDYSCYYDRACLARMNGTTY